MRWKSEKHIMLAGNWRVRKGDIEKRKGVEMGEGKEVEG